MMKTKSSRFWTVVTVLLVAVIVGGGIVAGVRYRASQPIEISLPPERKPEGRIYIGGNVTAPGFYPFTTGDTMEALMQAAGGAAGSSNLTGLKLYIPGAGEGHGTQKVDINRAEAWLLEALPGIGKTLAQRIVDYRQKNGPYRNTRDLLKVDGIGAKTYEQIKDLITVAD